MRFLSKAPVVFLAAFGAMLVLHLPLLRLPYFWDEAGYYIPAALDFYRSWRLIPASTLPSGHTPLVMIYLGLTWRLFGYSTCVARAGMCLVAAATAASIYALARRAASREIAVWSTLLLALSPLFFAQSTLVHLDLAAALFTTLAILSLLGDNLGLFALTASLAVLSKETAVVLLPVAWIYAWRKGRGLATGRPAPPSAGTESVAARIPLAAWSLLVTPLIPLSAWAFFYHHKTGYWTGNREYLNYNLYSTLSPARVSWSLLRRAYELFISGFNWLLTASAVVGLWWGRRGRIRDTGHGTRDTGYGTGDTRPDFLPPPEPQAPTSEVRALNPEPQTPSPESRTPPPVSHIPCPVSRVPYPVSRTPPPVSRVPYPVSRPWRPFIFLTVGLVAVYLFMLSVVGGAILPRYLLPVVPLFYLVAVALVTRLPHWPARLILAAAAVCFVWAWFINPPYPFPFEDNLAYADFIRLHQQAAHYLEAQPGQPRILTAWPATDELAKPILGYVGRPLRVVPVQGFSPPEFADAPPESFDLLYLYSRRWEPPGNWAARFPIWLRLQGRYFDYHPQVAADVLAAHYHMRLLQEMESRGQWVRIYSR